MHIQKLHKKQKRIVDKQLSAFIFYRELDLAFNITKYSLKYN